MHYRRLGRSGIKVSEISLGAWVTFGSQVNDKTASNLVHAAYAQGVNFFDDADVYANGKAEEVLGKAISDITRETVVISSKFFSDNGSSEWARVIPQAHYRVNPRFLEAAGIGLFRYLLLPPV